MKNILNSVLIVVVSAFFILSLAPAVPAEEETKTDQCKGKDVLITLDTLLGMGKLEPLKQMASVDLAPFDVFKEQPLCYDKVGMPKYDSFFDDAFKTIAYFRLAQRIVVVLNADKAKGIQLSPKSNSMIAVVAVVPTIKELVPKVANLISSATGLVGSAKSDFMGFSIRKLPKVISNLKMAGENLSAIAKEADDLIKGLSALAEQSQGPRSQASAQPQKKTDEGQVHRVQNYIAVMDLILGKGINPELKVLLTNGLMDELVQIGRFSVIDRANRNKILEEQGAQLRDCVDESCRVEVGRLLGVGKVVTGSITKIENTYFGMVQLINVETGKIESSAKEQCECSPTELLKLIRVLAGKLMGLPTTFAQYEQKSPSPYMPGQPVPSETERKGGLYIKTDPLGAEVTLNEQRVGETPLTLANLTTGNYRIEARKGDYYGRMDVDVIADKFSTVSIPMELLKARLTVITEPPEAQIFLDGQEVGKSPVTLAGVAVGGHRIEAQKYGYLKTGEDVSVSKSEEMITLSLVQGGVIKISSDPGGAQVEIAGKNIGLTPKEYFVSPGNYRVKIAKNDYQSFESRVQINAGEEKVVQATLVPNFGFLSVSSNPSGVGVLLDGKLIGKTPISKMKVNFGKHSVELKGDKRFEDKVSEAEVGRGEDKKLHIGLDYKYWYLASLKGKRKTCNITSLSSLSLAVIGAGMAVAFDVKANSSYDAYKKAWVQEDIHRHWNHYQYNREYMFVSIGVAGAGIAAAVIAFLARPEIPKRAMASETISSISDTPSLEKNEGKLSVYEELNKGHFSGSSIQLSGVFAYPGGLGLTWQF